MNKKPVNEGQEKVAAFLMDLQLFADGDIDIDNGGDLGGGFGVDVNAEPNNDSDTGDGLDNLGNKIIVGDDPGVVGQGGEGTPEPVKKQSPEADRAFAEMRRKAEAAERKAEQERRERDNWVANNFGESHGIRTWEQYQEVIAREKQQKMEQERQQQAQLPAQVYQKAISEGYDHQIAQLMADKVKQDIELQEIKQQLQVGEQRESERQRRFTQEAVAKQIRADHEELSKKYGSDLVPALDSLDEGTLAMMRSGVPLKAAWLATHEDEVLAFAQRSGANKTLKNVNSKAHLQSEKSGGGSFAQLPELSPGQISAYRKLFGPKMTIAEMKKREAAFIKKRGK